MFLTIYMHLYSIVETVLYVFYEAISNKSVYSLALVTGLTVSKRSQLEAFVPTDLESDLNWYFYLILGLILKPAFWLILEKSKQ